MKMKNMRRKTKKDNNYNNLECQRNNDYLTFEENFTVFRQLREFQQ